MRKFVFLLMLVLVTVPAFAQSWSGIIDPSRAVDWSNVGIPGGIPNRTTICATLNPGATGAQITAAIASCPAGQVVSLSAGTYNISDTGIDFANNSNVTLRGAGADKTFLIFSGNGNTSCEGEISNICIENGDTNSTDGPPNTANWTAGYSKGSTQITLSNTSNLAVGSVLVLDQLNDIADPGTVYICETGGVCAQEGPAGGERTDRAQQQFVKVTGISGSTVTISPGLYMPNWRSSQIPGAWWARTRVTMDGIEDLSLDGTNGGAPHNISLVTAYNCWVKGVRSLNANRDHINLYQAVASVVRDSYFYGTQNAASQSYGTESFMSSDNLIENNIFQHVTTPMQVNGSASGTVFGYNFSIDDYYSVSGNWMIFGNSLHAAGVDSVLFEGNDSNGLGADDIHGTHNFITAFRNQYLGWEPNKFGQTTPVMPYFGSRYFNIVGNVLGLAGYHTQYQDLAPNGTGGDVSIYAVGWFGNEGAGAPADSTAVSTLMRWGNYDVVNNAVQWNASEVPSGLSLYANPLPASHNLPASLYLSVRPSWWGNNPWPGIGPDVTGGNVPNVGGHADRNAAQNCYLSIGGTTPSAPPAPLSFNAAACYAASGPIVSSVSVSPANVMGGTSSTGTVTLSGQAPSGGITVALSSSVTSAATVPASMTVAANATSATFPIATLAVSTQTTSTITATLGVAQTATITVNPLTVSSVSLNPTTVVGGSANSTATVTLNAPAPSGGATVTLSSSNANAATVPSSVTVAANASSATFTVTSKTVAVTATSTITATLNGSMSATLTVNPVSSGGGVSFVRSAGNFGESVRYTVSIAPVAGHFLAVFVWQTEGAATPAAMTDNLGSVYTKDCDLTYNQGFGLRRLTVYHLLNAPGGITAVNITPNRASRGIVAEYSGMPTTGTVLDVCGAVNTNTTSSNSWTSTAATTTANDLVFGLADTGFSGNAGYSASGTWIGRAAQHDTSDADDAYFEDNINATAGSYTATGATTVSVGESSVVVAFTASTGSVAPAITSANNTTFTVGTAGTFTVTATGVPTPTLSETGTLPTGVAFNTGTGVLSGTPAAGTAGRYPITFSAQNGVGSNATQSFTLTVNPAPIAPTITSANNATFTVGTAGTFTVTATGTPTPTLSEAGALPAGVTFTPATGILSGTPAAGTGGTFAITITAANGALPNATQNFTLTVNQSPAITSANNTTFTVGTAGTFTVTATGIPVPTLSETGTLPTGVTFNAGTRVLSGTPAAGTAGSYPITFTAQNGLTPNATQSFTLMISASTSNVAFVKTNGNKGSAKYTVTIAPVATDFLAVFVWQEEAATTPTIADNLGSSYVKDCDLTYNEGFGARRLTVYHLANAPGGITGVSITPNKPSRSIIAEYSGMGSNAAVDVCGTPNAQSSTTSWSSTATATTSTDLIFGLADTGFTSAAGYKASGAWTGRLEQADTSNGDDSYIEDRLNVAAGSYTATGTTTGPYAEGSVIVAFKTH